MKIFLLSCCLLLLIPFSQPALCQELRVLVDKNNIFVTDPLILSIIFPKNLKKEFISFDYYTFPEIENFVKLKTEYEEDKENKYYIVRQFYRPVKAGNVRIPAFTISSGTLKISFPGNLVFVHYKPGSFSMPVPEDIDLQFESEKSEAKLRVFSDKEEIYNGEGFTLHAELLVAPGSIIKFKDFSQQMKNISSKLYPADCTIDPYTRGAIESPSFDTIQANGKAYKRLRLFEGKYYPIVKGAIEIPSIEFTLLNYKTARAPKARWWKSEETILKASALSIRVKDLPSHPKKEAVPVGSFQLKENISTNKPATGKAFSYVAIIQGNGNLAAVLPPPAQETENFEIYAPDISQRMVKDAGNFAGKIFTFEILPKEPGMYDLGKFFNWIYFNTETKSYDTLRSRYHVTVSGESQKNKEISSTVLGSFSELAGKESNKLRSKEKEESIKLFANIIILFMLVTTAILVFKR